MSVITTHVLDAVLGQPGINIPVRLDKQTSEWVTIGDGNTDNDGRCRGLCQSADEGVYRLTFAVQGYFESLQRNSIYSEITITFQVDGIHPYHIPLLLSDNSYTTYRGS